MFSSISLKLPCWGCSPRTLHGFPLHFRLLCVDPGGSGTQASCDTGLLGVGGGKVGSMFPPPPLVNQNATLGLACLPLYLQESKSSPQRHSGLPRTAGYTRDELPPTGLRCSPVGTAPQRSLLNFTVHPMPQSHPTNGFVNSLMAKSVA